MFNRMFRFLLAAGILFGMLSALPVPVAGLSPADRYVSTTGVDSGVCTNSAAPCRTIAYAITQSGSASADLIHIAAGTYPESLTIDRSVSLIGAQVNQTFIDGGGAGSPLILVKNGIVATVRDLSLQNAANPGGDGGAIYNSGTLTLLHVRISGNTAQIGGGIFNDGGLSLTHVFITGNSATNGPGGGIYNQSSSPMTLINVTVSDNTASGYSGGIHHQGAALAQLTNVTLSNNTAHLGGAMTITGVASVTFTNTTIANNHKNAVADSAIGGIADYGSVSMVNTIVYGNDGQNCGIGGVLSSLGYNLDGDATCLTPAIAQPSDHPNTDPLLGPLAENGGYSPTHALLVGSPAIDAGTNTGCPATDERSVSRPQPAGGKCDIGAFESGTYSLTIVSAHGTVARAPNKAIYYEGQVVKLTATPTSGWHFVKWTGGLTGADNPGFVTIRNNTSVTATYALDPHLLYLPLIRR